MRIRETATYAERRHRCNLNDCNRNYCKQHRLLWRDCDTAQPDMEGSGRPTFALGDCPDCESEARIKRYERLAFESQLDRMVDANIDHAKEVSQ